MIKWGHWAITGAIVFPMPIAAQAVGATQGNVANRAGNERLILPILPKPFAGKIARTAEESTPAFAKKVKAPAGAPNIILVMTDDVGFGASSTFGGLINTPALDSVAARGLRYNNFHTTGMCSPSRAALLTGRNSHAVGMGSLSTLATGFPGYYGEIPRNSATIGKILTENGYSTAFFGKHHNTPPSEMSPAGPFGAWPTGLGFEYFYGFVGSQTDQWTPALVRGTSRITPPPGEHLDKLLVDDAVKWLHNQKAVRPDKPFFIYLAPGTAHAPLQAPKEWIEKFRGKFDEGWDKARATIFERQKQIGVVPDNAVLTPRPSIVPAWSSLSPQQKAVSARMMEVYAAQLAYQDHQFGRLVAEVERMGQLENTLIIFIEGDNGASSEGGQEGTNNNSGRLSNNVSESMDWIAANMDKFGSATSHAHYPSGWAWAMNTPFQYFKRYASHLGGIRNGMVLSWPAKVTSRGIRSQFEHLVDVTPTILAAAGIPQPTHVDGVAQRAMDGANMMNTFASPKNGRGRDIQYFEILGNRSIYVDGWLASTTPPPAVLDTVVNSNKKISPLDYNWELYNLKRDFSQSENLAKREPQKLAELKAVWDREARKNDVFPIDNRLSSARALAEPSARLPWRKTYTYWGEGVELDRMGMAPILVKSFSLTADLTLPPEGGNGVIAAVGGNFGGWSFYLLDGRPVVHEAFSEQPQHQYRLEAADKVPPGKSSITYAVTYKPGSEPGTRGAKVAISINGKPVATGEFALCINNLDEGESFAIGHDKGIRVTDDYVGDGKFTGSIDKVEISFPDFPS